MLRSFLFDLLQSPMLDGHIIIVVDIVQTHDLYAIQGFQQLQHQIGADKTGCTGHQNGFSLQFHIGCQHIPLYSLIIGDTPTASADSCHWPAVCYIEPFRFSTVSTV